MIVVDQVQATVDKLRWGSRVVGPLQTTRGALRLAGLRLRRPARATVQLASGGSLTFDYPSQLAPFQVLFGDLVDPEYAFLQRLMQPDWTVIDVGAAIGQFSIFSALAGVGAVHAYEPSDANLTSLGANVAANGVGDQVAVHRMALSDHEGETVFATAATTYMSRPDHQGEGSTTSHPVPMARLDDELNRLGLDRVEVLKVNVAGFEPTVLDGAAGTLEQGRVDLLVLLIGTDSMDWYHRLDRLGYQLGFFHPANGTFHRIDQVDDRLLDQRPWPARHLLAVRRQAITDGLLDSMPLVPFI